MPVPVTILGYETSRWTINPNFQQMNNIYYVNELEMTSTWKKSIDNINSGGTETWMIMMLKKAN